MAYLTVIMFVSFYISDRLVAVAWPVYLLRYRLDDPRFKSRHRRGTFSQIVRTGCRINPAFFSLGAVFFQVVKWRGMIFTSLSSTKSKNEWSWTSTPAACLHGVNRDSFTFYLFTHVFKKNFTANILNDWYYIIELDRYKDNIKTNPVVK